MENVMCLNCGHIQEVDEKEIFHDELGDFVVCEECKCSFNVA